MGRDAFIVTYAASGIPRSPEFFLILETDFTKMNDTETILIDREYWEEYLSEHPEMREKFKEEIEAIETLLEKDETIELYIG